MNYLDKTEQELLDLLGNNAESQPSDDKNIVAFVRERLLESYKNGRSAAGKQSYSSSKAK